MTNESRKSRKFFNTDEETKHGFKVLMELSPFQNEDDLFKYMVFQNLELTNKNLTSPIFNIKHLKLKKQELEKEGQRNITKILLKKVKQPSNIQRLLNNLEELGDFSKCDKNTQIQLLDSILEECRITESQEGVDVLIDFVNKSNTNLKQDFLKKCNDYKEQIKIEEEETDIREVTDKRQDNNFN